MFLFRSLWRYKPAPTPTPSSGVLVTVGPDRSGRGQPGFVPMWTTRQLLQFSVKLGLRKGLKLIRGARRTFNEDEQDKIAEAIVEDLTRSNWKFEQGPPAVSGAHLAGSNEPGP